MKTRATTRALAAASLIAAVLVMPATAMGGSCIFNAQPNPGWPGATVTFSGSGMSPNVGYHVNFDGNNIKNGTTNGSGNFSFTYVLPGNTSVGSHNWFAFADSGCGMNDSRNYNVVAGPPATTTTTTTSTTTTTTSTTTTTLAPTTTVAGDTTTTVAGDTTTTAATDTTVSDTTTTTVAEEEDGGGIPIYIWVVIAALGALVLFLIGRMSSRRR